MVRERTMGVRRRARCWVVSRAGSAVLMACWGMLILASPLFGEDHAPALETKEQRESYSIGYQVGLSMINDGVNVEVEKLMQGLEDALDGKEPLMSEEEMRTLIVDLRQRAREAQLRKIQETIVRNAEESARFLEENGKKEGILTTESGLQYRVLREGDGPVPKAEDFVKVDYRGTFIDGTEFDSSYAKGTPQTFQTDGVIKGWTEALQMMKTGSKWQIFLPPDLAYGRRGLGQKIPPNKVLVFELELLSIEERPQGAAELEELEQKDRAWGRQD